MKIFTTITDEKRISLFNQTAKRFSTYVEIVKLDIWKGFYDRLQVYKRVLSKCKEDEICCFVDSYDVLINSNTKEILKKFNEYNCDLLIGAELNCFPDRLCRNYELKFLDTNSKYNYPNGGTYIGYAHAIMKMLNWKPKSEQKIMCKKHGDQAYLSEYYLANASDKILLDKHCRVFQNMHMVPLQDFEIKDGQVYNKVLQTFPCFVHFNGGVTVTNDGKNLMEIFVNKMKAGEGDFKECKQLITDTCYPISQV